MKKQKQKSSTDTQTETVPKTRKTKGGPKKTRNQGTSSGDTTTKAKSTKSQADVEKPSHRSTWRSILLLLLIIGTCVGMAAIVVRRHLVKTVHNREAASAASVLGRPLPISIGAEVNQSRLKSRLERLGYRPVTTTTASPGEFRWQTDQVEIFLRGFVIEGVIEQPAQQVSLRLSARETIESIKENKYGESLARVYLEPEMLAMLSDSISRSSTPKRLEVFPPALLHALLAIEDERFYSHFGLDPLGLGRALWANFRAGRVVQGGSTITQQLAKNLFFDNERTVGRKVGEALLAVLIETSFSKAQILELYLNEVFLGQEGNVAVHGFGEAAKSFFGKDISQLTIAESALLAGLVKAPTKLSPRRYPEAAKERRSLVLGRMLELGYLSAADHDRAVLEKITVLPAGRTKRVAPYFVDTIRKQLESELELSSLSSAKLRVVTGLDGEFQSCAERSIDLGLAELEKAHPRLTKGGVPLQGALVAVDVASAEIRAWVGGREYGENQFDRVSMAKRQPGSTFKPFVYLTALDRTLNNYRVARTTSVLSDEPTQLAVSGGKSWEPKNYDEKFRGDVTVREALTNSLNVPTVQLAMKVGIDNVARTAAKFGFGSDLPRVPSLALGAGEVSPIELARAYEALANGGILKDLRSVIAVLPDAETRPIYSPQAHEDRAASEPAVFILTDMLRSAVEHGTGQAIRRRGFKAPAAGKTGTSNDTHDAWFAGYTPRTLAIVWVGFDNNRELKLTGGQGAAPIWADFMKCIAGIEPELDFVQPPGVVQRSIDRTTGLLATSECLPSTVTNELFVEGNEPITPCSHESESSSALAPPEMGEAVLPSLGRQ